MYGESDYEELVAAARKKMPMRGDLYVLEQGQMTVKPDDFPYRAEDVLEAAQAAQEKTANRRCWITMRLEKANGIFFMRRCRTAASGYFIWCLNRNYSRRKYDRAAVIIAALVLLLISGIAIYVFSQYIIKPIFLIQKTIHGMVSGAEHVNT